MSVDEARRLLLHDAARTAWGAEAALVLMEMLPPTGWADVATVQQLDSRMDALRSDVAAQIADGHRKTMQWCVTTMIALTGVTTAIASAIARLG
jgi:hypothetical protein